MNRTYTIRLMMQIYKEYSTKRKAFVGLQAGSRWQRHFFESNIRNFTVNTTASAFFIFLYLFYINGLSFFLFLPHPHNATCKYPFSHHRRFFIDSRPNGRRGAHVWLCRCQISTSSRLPPPSGAISARLSHSTTSLAGAKKSHASGILHKNTTATSSSSGVSTSPTTTICGHFQN